MPTKDRQLEDVKSKGLFFLGGLGRRLGRSKPLPKPRHVSAREWLWIRLPPPPSPPPLPNTCRILPFFFLFLPFSLITIQSRCLYLFLVTGHPPRKNNAGVSLLVLPFLLQCRILSLSLLLVHGGFVLERSLRFCFFLPSWAGPRFACFFFTFYFTVVGCLALTGIRVSIRAVDLRGS